MPEKLHPPKFYADLSGITVDHLMQFIRSGELIATNIASPGARRRRWLIAESDWSKFLEARTSQSQLPRKPHGRNIPEFV